MLYIYIYTLSNKRLSSAKAHRRRRRRRRRRGRNPPWSAPDPSEEELRWQRLVTVPLPARKRGGDH